MDCKALNAELERAFEITTTVQNLRAVPRRIDEFEREAVEKQIKLDALRRVLSEAQEELERTRIEVSLEAMSSGVIDGRNKEQRELQLAAYLTKDAGVIAAAEQVRDLSRVVGEKEGELERVKVSVRRFNNELRALCHVAALHTEILRIVGGVKGVD